MSDSIRRTGEEPRPCEWFATCANETDIEVKHTTLGWTSCCEHCAQTVEITVPPPVRGWRVRTKYSDRGWTRTETKAFYNPLKSVCISNVQASVELWHPTAIIISIEAISPIQGRGWGDGAWTESFCR